MRQLDVYSNGNYVGRLSEKSPGRGYSFVYDDTYILKGLPSVSVLLPKSEKEFHCTSLFPFFFNMLPEGANKRIICREEHIDENDHFGLLYWLAGADFIGAMDFRRVE